MKRFASLFAAAGAVATVCAFALPGGAGATSSLPTFTISETGTTGITLSSSSIPAGAYNIVMNHTGAGGNNAGFQLVRLNSNDPNAIADGTAAVQAAHGDENALTPLGDAALVSSGPGSVQASLTPGKWAAINTTGQGQPGLTQFTVTPSSSGAALPPAAATLTAIEFGFKGPKVLHDGTVVRSVNGGYLVHMNFLLGAKSKAAGLKAIAALRAGKGMKVLGKYLTHSFIGLMGPGSPGAAQQMVLNAKPGFYVEACFMDTQDGRQHTQLGMERLVRIKS
jgi:hypothetical protein